MKSTLKKHIFFYFLIIFLAFLPIIIAMMAGYITELFGEKLNEANSPNILIFGDFFYLMGMTGWLSLITIPFGILALIVYTLYAVGKLIKDLKKK